MNFIGKIHIKKEIIASTNSFFKEIENVEEIENGTLVSAKFQSVGRGQRNNIWESEKNKNILTSFIFLANNILPDNQFVISKAVSLAIFDLLSEYKISAKIKWPNDIYINDKKIAGILIENSIRGNKISNSIIGIGLNINQINFSNTLYNATSLKLETNINYNTDEILDILIKYLNFRFNMLLQNNFNKINNDYLQNLYRFNEFHSFETDKEVFKAKIKTLDKIGRIVLETQNGDIQAYNFKEVRFL